MKYSKGYKYQLREDEKYRACDWLPDFEHEFFHVRKGVLTLLKGYAWDGASGPTIDTKNSMIPSGHHDACYQMIRLGVLPRALRKLADLEFRRLCVEEDMFEWRANLWYRMLRKFGPRDGGRKKEIIEV